MSNEADRLDGRLMDTRRDSADFRDRIYQPALLGLQGRLIPDPDRIRILDQGNEGACTGFGLAAMIDHLNLGRGVDEPVSRRMLYEMAKRHDRWPGEDYDGSSVRGAMKGWHKNGVAPEHDWPYSSAKRGYFTRKRQEAALRFPLGAYYRVLKKRSDLHAALHETGAVTVSAAVHDGWSRVGRNGVIPDRRELLTNGGHAFCVVGYTEEGFLIQNSWGEDWGGITLDGERYPGLAVWKYADFDLNYWDGWVARLALPVESLEALAGSTIVESARGAERVQKAPPRHEIAGYYIHIDDGDFDPKGDYPSSREETRELVRSAVENVSANKSGQSPGHILLYAHGGLNTVKAAAARAYAWRDVFEENRVHQIHFIWETGLVASIKDILLGKDDFADDRAGGFGDWKDRVIEKITRKPGYAIWKEMTEDADLGFAKASSAGSQTLKYLHDALTAVPKSKRPKLHVMGHSAGSIWMGHLLKRWKEIGRTPIETMQLFAPACTMDFYEKYLEKALKQKTVRELTHYQLDDATEKDDSVAFVYGKSLLYLVSRAYQSKSDVIPLMGMEKYWQSQSHARVTTLNTRDDPDCTRSSSHGGFDNDLTTMNHALQILLDRRPARPFTQADLSGY